MFVICKLKMLKTLSLFGLVMMTVSLFSPGWVKCVVYKFAQHLFSGVRNFLYPNNAHFLVGLRYSIVSIAIHI